MEGLTLLSGELSNKLGNVYLHVNTDSTEYWLLQSLDISSKLGDQALMAKNLYELGKVNYHPRGDLQVSLNYFRQSLPIYKELLNLKQITQTNYHIGKVSLDQGNLLMATEFLLKSLVQFEELRDSAGIIEVNNSMGVLCSKQQDFPQALTYHRRALAYEKQMGLDDRAGINYNNMGLTFKKMGKYDSALISYKMGLAFEQRANFPILRGALLDNTGNVMELLHEFDSAIYYHQRALNISEETGYKPLKGWANKGLSSVYFKLENYQLAIFHAKKAMNIGQQIGEKDILIQSADILHKIYFRLNDYKSAYNYLLIFKSNSDSLYKEESIRNRAALEREYRYKKSSEIQALELQEQEAYFTRKIDREKTIVYLLVACGSVILLFLVIIYRNYRIKRRVSLVLQEKNEIISHQAERLQKLNETKDKFYAILSHDLRGPMSVFQGVPIIVDSFLKKERYDDLKAFAKKVGKTSVKVTSLLDDLMTWAISQKKAQFPINKQAINLKHAIDEIFGVFESIADTKSIHLHSEIASDISIYADLQSIMTVFRNLVNNAIKFTPKNGEVEISYSRKKDGHCIMVSDNGVGINKGKMDILFTLDGKKLESGTAGEKGVGLGLQLVYDFVKLNDGKVMVESQQGSGTTFTILLPFHKEEQPEQSGVMT